MKHFFYQKVNENTCSESDQLAHLPIDKLRAMLRIKSSDKTYVSFCVRINQPFYE